MKQPGKNAANFITLLPSALATFVILATCVATTAQTVQESTLGETLGVQVNGDDFAAGHGVSDLRYHITRANTRAAKGASVYGPGELIAAPEPRVSELPELNLPFLTITALRSPGFYPADLSYLGGHTLAVATSHLVYLHCTTPTTCWGNPAGFLADLGKSTFIHLLDQYVDSTANNRYTIGTSFAVSGTLPQLLGLNSDIIPILHAVAKRGGTGYAHMYHMFIPKGIDVCGDDPTDSVCYSPDKLSTFVFCAFHISLLFPDVGHVLLTVEPFQDVPGCAVQLPSPNGQPADSTNSVLSHEFFETVTDPDVGSSWIAVMSLNEYGLEIGDICQPFVNESNNFLVPTVLINGKKYEIQLEYSNKYHGCTIVP